MKNTHRPVGIRERGGRHGVGTGVNTTRMRERGARAWGGYLCMILGQGLGFRI